MVGKDRDKPKSDDEANVFRDAMRDVKPIQGRRPHRRGPAPRAKALQRRADERKALRESLDRPADGADLETGEEMLFARPGLANRDLRKLRRGLFAVQAEVDLHGLTVGEATQALRDFVGESVAAGDRCVRVVHGKGLGSGPRGPVLKTMVNRELRRWDDVLAFCTTRPQHGGSGAVYVLLKRA